MVTGQRIAAAAPLCGILAVVLAHLAGHTGIKTALAGLLACMVVPVLGFVVVALWALRDPEGNRLVRPPPGGAG